MKTCKSCYIQKPLDEYFIDRKAKDGHKSDCKDCTKVRNQKWKKDNIEKVRENKKIYYHKNSEKIIENSKLWRNKNIKSINLKRQKYIKSKRETDPLFKMRQNLSNRTTIAFKVNRWNKKSKTQEMLGADYHTVFNHIQSKFKKGMSWDNHGEWHFDHIVPLASAKTEDELIKLCHYTNLQPLWAEENIRKGSKLIACKL
jgi:hypothetical protein